MKNSEVFKNEELGLGVRTIVNEDKSISINAEDTAIGFGWTQIKNGKIYPKWERINGFIEDLKFSPLVGKEDYIPESLFYLLGMKASNENAVKFQKWLAIEVIPDIRKNGMYATDNTIEDMLDNPDMMITLLTKYKEEKEERRKLELENSQKNELLIIAGERTSLIDDFLQASDIYSIDTVSKILAIKGMGRNNLYKYLREKKILMTDTYIDGKGVSKGGMKHFTAYASYTNDKCYFKHRTRDMQLRGEIVKQNVAMFTPIGVEWIYKKLIKDGWIQAKTLEEIIKELSKSEVA